MLLIEPPELIKDIMTSHLLTIECRDMNY